MTNHNLTRPKQGNFFKNAPFGWLFAIIIFFLLINYSNSLMTGVPETMVYSRFYRMLKDDPAQIKSLTMIENELEGELAGGAKQNNLGVLQQRLEVGHGADAYENQQRKNFSADADVVEEAEEPLFFHESG